MIKIKHSLGTLDCSDFIYSYLQKRLKSRYIVKDYRKRTLASATEHCEYLLTGVSRKLDLTSTLRRNSLIKTKTLIIHATNTDHVLGTKEFIKCGGQVISLKHTKRSLKDIYATAEHTIFLILSL